MQSAKGVEVAIKAEREAGRQEEDYHIDGLETKDVHVRVGLFGRLFPAVRGGGGSGEGGVGREGGRYVMWLTA